MNRVAGIIVALSTLGVLAAGCAQKQASTGTPAHKVAITVTEQGFEPAVVSVKAGEPVTLVVTRKTDKTCARDFVMPQESINKPLPLDQAVEITFTPAKPGDLTYACAMDMFKGTVRVE